MMKQATHTADQSASIDNDKKIEQRIKALFGKPPAKKKGSSKSAQKTQNTDQDTIEDDPPWKIGLRNYLKNIIDFCIPDLSVLIDWSVEAIPRDKEFEKMGPSKDSHKRLGDFLFQVQFKSGQKRWLLLHFEIQSVRQSSFPRRMFEYHSKILEICGEHPISIALLLDRDANWNPNVFKFDVPWTTLHFRYTTIKLWDLAERLDALKDSSNPIVILLRAKLAVLRSYEGNKVLMGERFKQKTTLVDELLASSLSQKVIDELLYLVDWIIKLRGEFMLQYKTEIREKRRKAPRFVSTLEQIGREEGLEQGWEQGTVNGERISLKTMIQTLHGPLSPELDQKIETLTSDQAIEWIKRCASGTSPADLLAETAS